MILTKNIREAVILPGLDEDNRTGRERAPSVKRKKRIRIISENRPLYSDIGA